MMVCTQCGFQNETEDAFCGSCGAFLEWAGESVGSQVSTPAGEAAVSGVELGSGEGAGEVEQSAPPGDVSMSTFLCRSSVNGFPA